MGGLCGGALWSKFSQPLLQEVLFVPTHPGALLGARIKTRGRPQCAPPSACSQWAALTCLTPGLSYQEGHLHGFILFPYKVLAQA